MRANRDIPVVQRAEVRRDLHRLPQPHLVADDASRVLGVELPQPPHARPLVREEALVDDFRHLEAAVEVDVAFAEDVCSAAAAAAAAAVSVILVRTSHRIKFSLC